MTARESCRKYLRIRLGVLKGITGYVAGGHNAGESDAGRYDNVYQTIDQLETKSL
ncbi:hypothetical protein DSM107010_14140 [Chroococcidiopsis cubana SAG 39.79]|uniref:Uncharacterized protein n=1 Tax=Chroococcidiopsis cubana SAG 39.79 TaxID=388085 RepID=A0AB37UPP1_9CYAN|nr:hypothetical protein DSM107010_14140 [Chroococcidiopsis cubana SAG 39.79]